MKKQSIIWGIVLYLVAIFVCAVLTIFGVLPLGIYDFLVMLLLPLLILMFAITAYTLCMFIKEIFDDRI